MAKIELNPSAKYLEVSANVKSAEKGVPQVMIYNPMSPKDRGEFAASLISLPERSSLAPWIADDPSEILTEAVERGIFLDKFYPDYLLDRAKRFRPKGYWDDRKEELVDFVHVHNLFANSTIAEFGWKEEGRFVRIPTKEGMMEVIHSSDGDQIPEKAKEVLSKVRIAFAGAGVGSSLLEGAVRAGVQHVTIADGGKIMYHDLNRLQGPDVGTVGKNHAIDAAEKAYAANPYLDMKCYPKNIGFTDDENTVSIDTFLNDADVVFEEIDNLQMKILIREEARRRGIPVFMATDIGLGTLVDYQAPNSDEDIFSGISREDYERVKRGEKFSFAEATGIAIQIVGPQNWEQDLRKGRSYWSQTGISADASKALAIATLVRWANGDQVPERQISLSDPISNY